SGNTRVPRINFPLNPLHPAILGIGSLFCVLKHRTEPLMPHSFRPWLAVCLAMNLLVRAATLTAADPLPDLSRGEHLRDAYIRRETQRLVDACLADIQTKADWERKRPELRRQFLEMMGLWPLPARTDLKPVITGKVESERFTIEKLHFQSSPGLYVTAN